MKNDPDNQEKVKRTEDKKTEYIATEGEAILKRMDFEENAEVPQGGRRRMEENPHGAASSSSSSSARMSVDMPDFKRKRDPEDAGDQDDWEDRIGPQATADALFSLGSDMNEVRGIVSEVYSPPRVTSMANKHPDLR